MSVSNYNTDSPPAQSHQMSVISHCSYFKNGVSAIDHFKLGCKQLPK